MELSHKISASYQVNKSEFHFYGQNKKQKTKQNKSVLRATLALAQLSWAELSWAGLRLTKNENKIFVIWYFIKDSLVHAFLFTKMQRNEI